MKPIDGKVAGVLLSVCLACAVPLLAKKKDTPAASPAEQKRAVHALNRLTFGPRPGDVQRVMAIGVEAWIDEQLHPSRINDEALESRLAPFRTLRLSPREVAEDFPGGAQVKQVMDGKRAMPSEAAKRAVYQVHIARQEAKQEEKRERKAEVAGNFAGTAPVAANTVAEGVEPKTASVASPTSGASRSSTNASSASMSASTGSSATMEAPASEDADGMMSAAGKASGIAASGNAPVSSPASGESLMATARSVPSETKPAIEDAEAKRREERLYADLEIQKLPELSPDQRYKKILAMSVDDQVAFADSLRGGKGQDFLAGMDPKQKETLQAMNNPQGVVTDELLQAKVLRAVYSERQLEEVMTDFWFNHFNIYVGKGPDRLFLSNYEQDAIRPHVLGKFEDLLVATAKSPAMLFYLDNWLSVGPDSDIALGIHPHQRGYYRPSNRPRKRASGLNENYGRELMELHTLSVNGGYSQQDVTEVAKVFTGWTLEQPKKGADFRFEARMHE